MQRTWDWMREAEAELAAARTLYEAGHWAWCCFTCQQAAERALKAVCEHLRTPQTGHNLNLLLQAVADHVPIPDVVREGCARLNRHYVPTRYPNAFDRGVPAEQFFEADARQALRDAEEVVHFAQTTLGGR
ncbi:MAG: HEPN domain-containing protein [Armatimonadota bacterium]|nr:HEPN domain-containing protein [Armatimonadota bacterium]MDW8155756.1 HEPN domain-containing protein [Armatimonadota bacterium]